MHFLLLEKYLAGSDASLSNCSSLFNSFSLRSINVHASSQSSSAYKVTNLIHRHYHLAKLFIFARAAQSDRSYLLQSSKLISPYRIGAMTSAAMLVLILTVAASLQYAYSMSAALYYNETEAVVPETCQVDFTTVIKELEGLSKGCKKHINFTDCCQPKFLGLHRSGVYMIRGKPTFCDMETGGGNWMVIQRRSKANKNFYKNWKAYSDGFGNANHDFWYGLDAIHHITAAHNTTELRVDLQYKNGTWIHAKYRSFKVGSSEEEYVLSVDGHSGSASDSMQIHNNMKFSTYDNDNDRYHGNCAKSDIGAWWYNLCYDTNLNGYYDPGRGVTWRQNGRLVQFTKVEMKIRPRTWYCK